MFLQRQDINSFDSIEVDDISYRVLHDLLLFIYSGFSSVLKDKPFDLAAGSFAAAAAAEDDDDDDEDDGRLRPDLLQQLIKAADKYKIAELKTKAESELAKIAPLINSL